MTYERTRVEVFARAAHDGGRHGVPADHPKFGVVELVRVTRVETVTSHSRNVLREQRTEEVLCELTDVSDAAHLARSLIHASVQAHREDHG